MGNVMAPIDEWDRGFLWILLSIKVGVHVPIAAVGFQHWRNQKDGVLANVFYEWSLFDRQAIGKLHEHFGGAAFGRMHGAGGPIHGDIFFDQTIRLSIADFSWITKERVDLFVFFKPLEIGSIRNG